MARTTLVTLAGFVDWINMQHITDDDSRLLQILCQELGNPELELHAAECAAYRQPEGDACCPVTPVTAQFLHYVQMIDYVLMDYDVYPKYMSESPYRSTLLFMT